MENNELDIVVFEDDDGNELTMEVLDYLFYEGKEYALLTEYVEDEEARNNPENPREAFIMEVRPLEDDEENEEFVPIPEELAEKLIEIFESGEFDDEEFDDFEDEE